MSVLDLPMELHHMVLKHTGAWRGVAARSHPLWWKILRKEERKLPLLAVASSKGLVRWVRREGFSTNLVEKKLVEAAGVAGEVGMVKWLLRYGSPVGEAVRLSARKGREEVLRWFLEHGYKPNCYLVVMESLRSGHFPTMEVAWRACALEDRPVNLDWFAVNQCPAPVFFWLRGRGYTLTPKLLLETVESGRMDLLPGFWEELQGKGELPSPPLLFESAGTEEVFAWLHKRCGCFCETILRKLVFGEKRVLLSWILRNCRVELEKELRLACFYAIEAESSGMLRWCLRMGFPITEEAWAQVPKSKNSALFLFLLNNLPD